MIEARCLISWSLWGSGHEGLTDFPTTPGVEPEFSHVLSGKQVVLTVGPANSSHAECLSSAQDQIFDVQCDVLAAMICYLLNKSEVLSLIYPYIPHKSWGDAWGRKSPGTWPTKKAYAGLVFEATNRMVPVFHVQLFLGCVGLGYPCAFFRVKVTPKLQI